MISDLERIINIEFICKAKLEILEFGDSIQLTCDPRKEITVTKLVIYYLTYFLAVLLAVSSARIKYSFLSGMKQSTAITGYNRHPPISVLL